MGEKTYVKHVENGEVFEVRTRFDGTTYVYDEGGELRCFKTSMLAPYDPEQERDAFKSLAECNAKRIEERDKRLADAQATIATLQGRLSGAIKLHHTAEQQVARLRRLIASAKCPTCDGSGWYHDTDLLTGEPVQAQCRWCTEQQALRETGV